MYVELSANIARKAGNYKDRDSLTSAYIVADYMRPSLNKLDLLLNASSGSHYVNSFWRARRNWEQITDFEYIGATFIGPASTRYFVTNGIYEDFEITENEYAYVEELISLLDKVSENITGSNTKDDLSVLNSNFEDMHEQLYDMENSPYRFIKKQPTPKK